MTDSLSELIRASGENAEAKGFHEVGNLLRWLLGEQEDGKEIKLLVDGEKWDLPDFFWKQLYAAYKGNRLMLIVGELVEAHEEIRSAQPPIYTSENGKPEGTAVELSDVQIRLADYVWEFEEPMIEALEVKAAFNKTRAKMHGGRLF